MGDIFCTECGAKNPDYANFCQECGKKIHSKNLIKEDHSKTPKDASPGSFLNNVKINFESDLQLIKEFGEDIKLIIEKYGSNEVKTEKEFQKQIKKVDSQINLKKKKLDKKLKYFKSDMIKVEKIRDENKPFHIKYSVSLKEGKKDYDEHIVFFTDFNNNRIQLKVLLWKDSISIPDINFMSVSLSKSKDGNFVLTYNDQYFMVSDGIRTPVKGRIVFINQNDLFLISALERPNDGKLAENGNFIINDWMSDGHLNGIFYAFNSEANVIIKRKFNSNLGKNCISENGHYAVLETYHSKSEDGNKIFFFDLDNRKLLWERKRDAGNIKLFKFDDAANILLISYEKGGKYRYSFKGEFSDKDKFMKERLVHANGYELFDIAKEKMDDLDYKTSDLSDYEEVLSILIKASNKDITPHTKARIHRIIGEIYYNYGKKDEALNNFKKALSNDPKVGVKRLFDKLNKN